MSDQTMLKLREDRARRGLGRLGYRLKKTPARSWLRRCYGPGYMVISEQNHVKMGCASRAYEATIDDVDRFIAERPNPLAA